MKQALAESRTTPTGADARRSDQHGVHLPAPARDELQQWSGHMCVDAVATSGPQPRAALVATEAGLKLNGTLGDFKLSPTAVQCVKRAGFYPWLWGGIRIYHSVPGYPQRLQFCPMGIRSRQVLAQLRALGFKTA